MRYRFDEFMARGTPALIAGLALVSIVIIGAGGALVFGLSIADADGNTFTLAEALWASLNRAIDSGAVGGDSGWLLRLVMFGVTIGGIFVLSALIGILNNALEAKLDELRKGRSPVIERGHTVILGWSGEVFPVIEQLVEANRNRRKPCIAILADRDKVEMEEEIALRVPELANTKIVCRSGSPIDLDDIAIANISEARSVIVLPAEDDPDASVVKTLLAVSKSGLRADGSQAVVAKLSKRDYILPSKIAVRGALTPVVVEDVIPRVVAQTCRQTGLSNVYVELLDFQGAEIYFSDASALIGKTYRDAVLGYGTSAVIGLVDDKGVPAVNPPMATKIGAGWKVIAISEDDDTVIPDRTSPRVDDSAIVKSPAPRAATPERIVVVGWNSRLPAIVRELDAYVAKGSEVVILGSNPDAELLLVDLAAGLRNVSHRYVQGDTTDRETLESLCFESAEHVIVLCDDTTYAPDEADSRTLVSLIHIRDIAHARSLSFSLTSQILDIRNRALAEVAEADDFIVSDRILSLMVAQFSENPGLEPVLGDLFDPEGSEIYIKPISDYVKTGVDIDFYTVAAACAERGHTAIGYRLVRDARDHEAGYGVVVNPRKSDRIAFGDGDGIVVVAED